jgi:hypothetical protein
LTSHVKESSIRGISERNEAMKDTTISKVVKGSRIYKAIVRKSKFGNTYFILAQDTDYSDSDQYIYATKDDMMKAFDSYATN